MKGLFDTWASYTAGREDQKLYLLEEKNGVKLLKLQTWFDGGREKYAESPTYHVWVGDKWKCATLDYEKAIRAYEGELS